jgi:tetratricopeptide (TPR) repeat protein
MSATPSDRRYGSGFAGRRIFVVLVLAAAAAAAATFFWLRSGRAPEPGSRLYREYQRAFRVGLAALEAGREDLAREKLDEAAKLVPQEPAAWANLGLLHLRSNDLAEAARDLEQARKFAPASGEIQALLGILAEKQGRVAAAVTHFRSAAAHDPQDSVALYSLAQAISKEGKTGAEAEYQQLMEQILKVQPSNLPVLMEQASTAFRRQDQAAFQGALERLAGLSSSWTPAAQKKLDDVRQAAANLPKDVPRELPLLDNLLKAERGYAQDSFAIRRQPGFVGTPVRHFLVLARPRSTPAPPDAELSWRAERLPTPGLDKPGLEKSRWDVLRTVWLAREKPLADLKGGAKPVAGRASDVFALAVFVANGREIRRADVQAPPFPFPGGPNEAPPTAAGVLTLDWNNDFRIDLLLAGAGGLAFWQQGPDGSFASVNANTDLAAEVLSADYFGAWAADIDMDGDLDVLAARRLGAPLLLRNNGDGTFKALEIFPGMTDVRAFAWADLDHDGTPDAVVLDGRGKLNVFANERSGRFSARPVPESLGSILAVTVADMSTDGELGIVALQSDGALLRLSHQGTKREWHTAELARGAESKDWAHGTVFLLAQDLDNNGAVDFVVAGPQQAQVYLGDEQGKLTPLRGPVELRVASVVDLDGDGRLDLVGLSADEQQPTQSLNQGRKPYKWQALLPLANPRAGDNRINSYATGGEIEISAGSLVHKRLIEAPVVHFGLGAEEAVDVVRIVWPNGEPQWEFDVAANHLVTAEQRLSGSCPFLFTFDGTDMRFRADFMCQSPQTNEWLKIAGEHLVSQGGAYDVRVHSNMWETDYFDHLALLVIDHPRETEMHVDEGFFLTPTKPSFHITTLAKPVARATDHKGSDVTDLVRAVDGRYVDRAGRGRFQGVTQDHWVEVKLGDEAPRAGPVLLVARGWLHPTNNSISAAMAQGKHDMPRPVALEVPDGHGNWRVAAPALGFPAGRDKTMLIRLDGLVDKGVCRHFRLRTNMEVYWDYLGCATLLGGQTLDKVANDEFVRVHRPEVASAELRFRGTLAMIRKDDSSPEVPLYNKVQRGTQAWRDLQGFYTRFGDVRELLAAVEDRYVIMNAGDEIAMRFKAPDGPPAGWRRDFIWHSDGWARDGDFNTRFGNAVLPLPAHGIDTDSRSPGHLVDDPVYQRFPGDWQVYHTRYVSADLFARGLWQGRRPRDGKR